MNIELYCDESNQELLSSVRPSRNKFFLIGGVWLPSEKRLYFKQGIDNIKYAENCFGEAKWNKVCPSKLSFYIKLVDFFFQQGTELRFRCIVIDTQKIDLVKYHKADQELGYYKFCYQLLKNWIESNNSYHIFFDCKTNRNPDRLHILERYLRSNTAGTIRSIQNLPSKQIALIQLTDVILGAVSAKFNGRVESSAKNAVIRQIETHLGHEIMPTSRGITKFNIFKISLTGSL